MIIDPNNSNVNSSTVTSARTRASNAAADVKTANQTAAAEKPSSDSVSLSDKGQALGRLEAQIASTPDVDEAKVAAVKAAIAEGRYQIDSETIAERMLAQDNLLD